MLIFSVVQDALNPVAFLEPSVLKTTVRLLLLVVTGSGGVLPQAALPIRLSSES